MPAEKKIVVPEDFPDLTEANYIISQIKAAAREVTSALISAVDALIRIGYPEEDIEWKIGQDLTKDLGKIDADEVVFQLRRVIRLKRLDFSKEQLVKIKAKKLAEDGTPTGQICTTLYDQLKGRVSKQMIRRVCSKLGYTDSRFKNRR